MDVNEEPIQDEEEWEAVEFSETTTTYTTIPNFNMIITELLGSDNDSEFSHTNEYIVDEPIDSYKNVKYLNNNSEKQNNDDDDNIGDTFQYIYTNNEFYNEDYIKNPLLRGITLSKWPHVGFGFKLCRCEEKKHYFIEKIVADSPADSCLNLGDLIVELDEFDNPFDIFNNLNQIEDYLNSVENLHLVCIAHDNFLKFKLKNKSLKSYSNINCEDIVVVSWNQLKNDNQESI